MPVSCISLCMEISIDGDSKPHINIESIIDEQASQPLEKTNKEFHDAQEINEQTL